jgi:hypothetical protein
MGEPPLLEDPRPSTARGRRQRSRGDKERERNQGGVKKKKRA